jgi:hypothetical protein
MGTLAAYAATGTGKIALAQKNASQRRNSSSEIQALPVRRYDIPPGKLEEAIRAFEPVSGVTATAANTAILDVRSPGATGVFTADEALKTLLANTGVTHLHITLQRPTASRSNSSPWQFPSM